MEITTKNADKWLYVRFPKTIKDEQEVMNLHKDIVSVKFPRQKTRFCYIELADEETANNVREELHHKEHGKSKLYVFKKRIGKRVKKRFSPSS